MRRILSLATFAAAFVTAASGAVIYDVDISTATIKGTSGGLDFTFTGGIPDPQSATLTISGFTSDGTLGAATSNNTTGTLPGTVSLGNLFSPPSDYFTTFSFGTTIHFTITFNGPAVTSPDHASGDSTFAFSLLDSGDQPVLTHLAGNPGGFAFTAVLDNAGSAAIANQMTTGTVHASAPPASIPEPEPWAMALIGAGLMTVRRYCRRR